MKTLSRSFVGSSLLLLAVTTSATLLQARDLNYAARILSADCNFLLSNVSNAKVVNMLEDHELRTEKRSALLEVIKINFGETDGRDVYNSTPPFLTTINGQEVEVIAGRVEPRTNHDSEVWFFVQQSENYWVPVEKMFELTPAQKKLMKFGKGKVRGEEINGAEDPFITQIDGENVLGFVETFKLGYLDLHGKPALGYRTAFYRDNGRGLAHFERFTTGPRGMKDIRLGQQKPGSPILVITRPQNSDVKLGGRGKNAVLWIENLNQLKPERILQARLIHGQVGDKEWIGSNQIDFDADGTARILAHVAYYKDEQTGERGYYPVEYTLDPQRHSRHEPLPRILFRRSDLNEKRPWVSKRPDLDDVIFASGRKDGWTYIGVGDALFYKVRVRN